MLVLCIASLIFLTLGGRKVLHDSRDFIPVYTGARCLLHGCNPYVPSQLEQQFLQAGGRTNEVPDWKACVPVYPPSAFLVLSPLALLPYPLVCPLWFLLNGCLFIASAGLVLFMSPRSHRWLATILVSLIVVKSGEMLQIGQPTVFATSLLVMGCYCFLRQRCLSLGVVLLMLSLAVKPQMGGLIVLYLVVRRIHWRYAVLAMAGACALLLAGGLILTMRPSSADWTSVLHANLSATEEPGGVNDPRPNHKPSLDLANLQVVTSAFSTNAREFNAGAYAVCLVFLAALVTAVLRTKTSPDVHLLSIGALAVLTLMPVYHRFYDARILLITVPAVVIVYRQRRLLGALMGALTVLIVNFLSVQSRTYAFLSHHAIGQFILQSKFLSILFLQQQNLELPVLFCLYIVAILLYSHSHRSGDGSGIFEGAALGVN